MPRKEISAFAEVIAMLENQEYTCGEGQNFLFCFLIRMEYYIIGKGCGGLTGITCLNRKKESLLTLSKTLSEMFNLLIF